jgi:hypothetical protein
LSLLVALVLASATTAKPITEDQAIRIVANAMRRLDPVPPRCLWYDTEARSREVFEIAVRENHNRGCPGDPSVAPVVERFRVIRSPVSLWQWDPSDTYARCTLKPAKSPVCPK